MAIVRMQQRRDTALNWSTYNPVLRQGELGFDTNARKFKIGDGETDWNGLDYLLEDEVAAALAAQGAAEDAQAAAEAAAAEAEATAESVIPTTDAAMTAVAGNPTSAFAIQQSASYSRRTLPTNALGKMQLGTNIKITFLGDSVLQGSTATTPGTDDAASLVCSTLGTRFGVTVTKDNQAQGGRTAWWEFVEKWDAALTANADVYVLGITGKNDASYEVLSSGLAHHQGMKQSSSLALIESKVRELRYKKPDADIILFSGNPYGTAYTTTNPVQKKYSRGLARIAAHYGLPYADGWGYTTKSAAGSDYAAASVLSDGVHPNSAGHAQLANAILDLFPADYDPMRYATPALGGVQLPPRIYSGKHAIAIKQLTGHSVTAYTDRILTPAFVGGSWTGTGPWTSSTANDTLMAMAKATDFSIRFTYGAGQGVVDIIVDGETFASAIDLSTVTDADQWFSIPDLFPGVHHVTVKVISGSVTVERMGFVPAACEFIDIRDSRVTTTNLGATNDINQYYGVHSNGCGSTTTITVPFVGTGLAIECSRVLAGGGAYWSAITVDGASLGNKNTIVSSTFVGYGDLLVTSGLDYGYHVAVFTFQAGTIYVGGFSVLDERPELHLDQCAGVAKVGETVRPALPFAEVPDIKVVSTTANAANPISAATDSFGIAGTAGDVVRWFARSLRRVLF